VSSVLQRRGRCGLAALTKRRPAALAWAPSLALTLLGCGEVAGLEAPEGTATFTAQLETAATCDIAGVESVALVAQRLACPVGEAGEDCTLGDPGEESREGTGISCPAAAAFTAVVVDVDAPGTYRVEALIRASDSSVERRCLRTSAGADPEVTRDDLASGATIPLELQPVGACAPAD
jgi:hypothetical protein